ncbi:Uncharacterized protein FKW44_006485, partial [Caligus rogercresseyi]
CRHYSNCVVRCLEAYFQCHGRFIGRHPILVIILCIFCLLASFCGLPYFQKEERRIKLWASDQTPSRLNHEFLNEHFPSDFRFANIIVEGDNVLEPRVIRALFKMRNKIASIHSIYGDTLESKCAKFPVVKSPNLLNFIFGKRRRRRKRRSSDDFFSNDYDSEFFNESFNMEEEDEENSGADVSYPELLSVESYPEPYCGIVEGMEETCFESSLLELWGNNGEYDSSSRNTLESSNSQDILNTVNSKNTSGIFLIKKNFTDMLGGISRDPVSGRIIGAKALRMLWFLKMNVAEARMDPVEGQGVIVDKKTMEFEKEMLDIFLNETDLPEGVKISPHVSRSFFDIAGPTILGKRFAH